MGLFDEQLNARQENDREAIKRSLGRLGAAVTGRVQSSVSYHLAENAVQEIFDWFEVKPLEPPSFMTGFDDRLNFMLNPTGILRRTVKLTGRWWKDAAGPMLAFTAEGEAVALFPRRFGGYGKGRQQNGGKSHRRGHMLLPSVSSAVVDIERFRHFLPKVSRRMEHCALCGDGSACQPVGHGYTIGDKADLRDGDSIREHRQLSACSGAGRGNPPFRHADQPYQVIGDGADFREAAPVR